MYTNLYYAEQVHQIGGAENRSLWDSISPRSDRNSAAGLFRQRQAQLSGWVEKTTQH